MARLLVATVPLTGHVQPMALLVRELVARGHEVTWYAGTKFAATIARTGAQFAAMRSARDYDDADIEAAFPALRGQRGLARVKRQLRELFIAPMADGKRDLEELARAIMPDAIIADSAHLGAAAFAEASGTPWVGLGISALMAPSIDTAPFGSAYPPAPGKAGERRNKIMNHVVFRVMFADVNRAYRKARVAAGLPAGERTYFDVMAHDLFLQPTVPGFEYPRRDLPSQVRFIGALVPPPTSSSVPPWWPDVALAREQGRPIVHVTQGTLATDPGELIAPALAALASEDVLVVVTGRYDGDVPANARVAPYVPYTLLLPNVSAMITNAGYGGVQMALHHGIPIVAAGGSEEKPEIAARIAWSGTGIDLETGTPSPKVLRAAVRRVLDEASFRERAREIAREMATYDAPSLGAAYIEEVVADHLGRRESA